MKDYGSNTNISTYLKKTFMMFGGENCKVEIKFTNDMINIIIDRFGEEITTMRLDSGHFKVITDVNAGEGFMSWVLQFGDKAEVLYPEKLREVMKQKIKKMRNLYM